MHTMRSGWGSEDVCTEPAARLICWRRFFRANSMTHHQVMFAMGSHRPSLNCLEYAGRSSRGRCRWRDPVPPETVGPSNANLNGRPRRTCTGQTLPNPADVAKTYAEVAQRASRLPTQFMERKPRKGQRTIRRTGRRQGFMDLSSRLLANPAKLAQTQMNMMWTTFALAGIDAEDGRHADAPIAAPEKSDIVSR